MKQIILVFNIIKDYLAIIYKYVISNNLNIDKGTFFTIIIGEVTVFGILLAFYQFLASYKFNENSIDRYLGINVELFKFEVNKKIMYLKKRGRLMSFLICFLFKGRMMFY